MFSGVFIAGEIVGVGDIGSGDTRTVVVMTLFEACELNPEICLFSLMNLFFFCK